MGDTATMSTPCAEEVTVAERKAAFDSSVCHDTRSQSGAIEEGVGDDLPGNITPPAAIAGQGYIPLGATPPDPDPPRAIVPPEMRLVNCDIPGHPPWLCDAICHLPSSVCKAAPNYEWLDFARTCRLSRQQVSLHGLWRKDPHLRIRLLDKGASPCIGRRAPSWSLYH